MKKSLLFGLLAVFAAVFIFTACDNGSTDTTPNTVTVTESIEIDYIPGDEDELATALENGDYKVIGITNSSSIDLSGLLTATVKELVIPAGKTVYVVDYGVLSAVDDFTLKIDGELKIGVDGTVTTVPPPAPAPDNKPIVVRDGSITVLDGGRLTLRRIKDINDGAETKPATVVGTSKVKVQGGTLRVSSIPEVADLQTAFASIEKGLLEIDGAKSFKPSDVVGIGTITEERKVTMSVTAVEDATSLTIPKGLDLTSSSNLATVESLTVEGILRSINTNPLKLASLVVAKDGIFTARGNFALLTSLTVDGTFTPGTGSVLTALKTLIVNGTVNTAGSTLGQLTVTVGDGGTLALAAATLEGESVVDGTLTLVGDVVLAADAKLSIDETKVLGGGKIIAIATGSSITFVGYGSGYTTTSTGVVGTAIAAALDALEDDLETMGKPINLDLSIGLDPGNTIGTVLIDTDNATAEEVKDDVDGSDSGANIAISYAASPPPPPSTLAGTLTASPSFELSVDAGKLMIKDTGYAGSTATTFVLAFDDVQIVNSDLIAPEVRTPAFSIGVVTSRAP